MYDSTIHHRRSIRLPGYDYAGSGFYFITICVQGKACLFGEIVNGEMHLNDAGRMVEKWYAKLEEKFPDIHCGEYIVMPNHFHCILENTGMMKPDAPVGANPCVRPTPNTQTQTTQNQPPDDVGRVSVGLGVGGLGEHMGSPLRVLVQWFKTMTTNEYIRNVKTNNWPRFDGKLWQRNYWEHIIRNEKSHRQMADYIINNPRNWYTDSINPVNEKQPL